MKRNILSVLLACLMIVSLCLMVGCKTDDLEAQIVENDAKQEGAMSDLAADLESDVKSAADTAAANLAEAQKKLEAMISGGDAVDAAALKAATAEFNAALAAAEEALNATINAAVEDATDAYTALQADLEKAIEDAVAAVTAATDKKLGDIESALKDLIADGNAVLSADVDAVAAELALLQDSVLTDMVALDAIVKQELTAKFNKVVEDLATAVAADLADAVATLEQADEDNKAAAEKALADAVDAAKVVTDALDVRLTAVETLASDNEAAIEALTNELNNDIKTAITALQNNKANKTDVASEITRVEGLITTLDTTLRDVIDTLSDKVAKDLKDAKDELNAAIDALADKVAKDLKDAKDELNAAIALKADKTALDAAIAEYKKLVKDAEDAATAANNTLETTLRDVITTADEALQADIDDLRADLQDDIDDLKQYKIDNEADITDLENRATALEDRATALETAADALANKDLALDQDIADLYDYIDAKVEAWNAGTEAAVEAIVEINTIYNTLVGKLSASEVLPVSNFYEVTKVEVIRALDAATVEAVTNNYKTVMASLTGVADTYNAIDFDLYYATEQKAINDLFAAAIGDIIADQANVATIEAKFVADVDDVLTKAEVILASFDALGGALVDKVEFTTEWDDAITAAENAILAETLPNVVGDADFIAMVDTVTALRERYIGLTGYADGVAIADRIKDVLASDIIFNDTVFEAEVADIRATYEAWLVALPTNAALVDEIFVDDMLTKFAAVEARIVELDAALVEAEALNARIETLIANIVLNTVSNANKTELEKLPLDIAAWADKYFAGDYADEKVDTHDNYNMVAHNRMADAQTAWDDAYALFEVEALPYYDAVAAIPSTLDILSGDEITAAIDYYTTMSGKLGKYDIVFTERFGNTPAEIYNQLLTKMTQFESLVANANTAFDAAYALVKDYVDGSKLVTIYTTDFTAILAWIDNYAVKDAEGNFVYDTGDTYKAITSGFATADFFNNVLRLQSHIEFLVEEKNEETQAVKDLIDAIGDVVIKTDLANGQLEGDSEEAIIAAENALQAWVLGTAVPSGRGFVASQFKPDPVNYPALYVIEASYDTTLNAARAKYNALAAAANAIHDFIDIDVPDYEYSYDIADDADRNDAEAKVTDAYAQIAAFNTANPACSVEFDVAKLEVVTLAIARYDAVAQVKAYYVADAAVQGAIDALYVQATDAIDNADEADLAGIVALAKAKYDAISATEYKAALAALTSTSDALVAAQDALADILADELAVIENATTADEADDYAAKAQAKFDLVVAADADYTTDLAAVQAKLTGAELTAAEEALLTVFEANLNAIVAADEADDAANVLAGAKYDDVVALANAYAAIVTNVTTKLGTGAALDATKVDLKAIYDTAVAAIVAAADADASDAAVVAAGAKFDAILVAANVYVNAVADVAAIALPDVVLANDALLAAYNENVDAIVAGTEGGDALAVAKYADVKAVANAYVAAIAKVEAALATNYAAKNTVALAALETAYENDILLITNETEYILSAAGRFDAIVEVAEKYAAADTALAATFADPSLATQLAELQVILADAFDDAMAIATANDVAALLAEANAVFEAVTESTTAYIAAAAKVAALAGVYNDAKVYDIAKAALDAEFLTFDTVTVDTAVADLTLAADKFNAIVSGIDTFVSEYSLLDATTRPVLETAFENAIPKITAATENIARVVELMTEELQAPRLG